MIGRTLNHYEIQSKIGEGGMGEVYQAKDTRLGRNVAVKVLPEVFAHDGDRLARFDREAKLLASLNHPNIAALYGMEQAEGKHFLVMELVEGETLAERLRRGAIPVEDTLRIARQISEALEAAHDKGVVHRDLKPANVKITPDGKVKVLDFGLAKAMENAPANASLSNSPTISMAATNAGIILGTAAYMSPEQANGLAADVRSDTFSFGSVLYEMLTGRQPFQGKTISEVLASVLVRDPDWSSLAPNLNPRIPELVRRCLEKDVRRRWQAIGDVRVEVERLLSDPAGTSWAPQAAVTAQPIWRRVIPVLLTAIVVGFAVGFAVWNLKPSTNAPVTRFSIVLSEQQLPAARRMLALSPDGSRLAYIVGNQLYLRSMADMDARPVTGAGGPISGPFFSPDGQWIGFWSGIEGALQKISVTGGVAITISKIPSPLGASWDGDRIIFGDPTRGVMSVSANGGEPEVLVAIKPEDGAAHGPQLLNQGRTVLFTLSSSGAVSATRWDKAQIVVQSLPAGERKVVVPVGRDGRYVPSGHVLYAAAETVFAIPFDLSRLEPKGSPVDVIQSVMRTSGGQPVDSHLALSATGTLAYIPGGPKVTARRTLAMVDRSGKAEVLPVEPKAYLNPRISPDGKNVVVGTDDGVEAAIWIHDLGAATTLRRLTVSESGSVPLWSYDGRYVIFRQSDGAGLVRRLADGTGTAEEILKANPSTAFMPFAVEPFGKALAYGAYGNTGVSSGGILVIPLIGDPKPQPIPDNPSSHAAFSPDGRWLAYTTPAIRRQLFVRPYPAMNAKFEIIAEGGNWPVWSPDGKQIFYVRPPNKFFAVDIVTEPTFNYKKAVELPITETIHDFGGPRNFDITPDGRHFLVVIPAAQSEPNQQAPLQINVVLNWLEELKRRVPLP